MNRIREVHGGYQVLTTPHRKYDVGFEFMLGSWTDEGLLGFKVYEFDSYADAECEAMRHPDISWERLNEFHKDQYELFGNIISKILNHISITSNFYQNLMGAMEIKNTMMNRVLKIQKAMNVSNNSIYNGANGTNGINGTNGANGANGTNSVNGVSNISDVNNTTFRLAYDMNDIISYVIVNPWSSNLKKIESFLFAESRLNLYKKHAANNIVHLVGRTDIGTTYEIILAPSIMYHFMLDKENNREKDASKLVDNLKKAIIAQKAIDRTDPIV